MSHRTCREGVHDPGAQRLISSHLTSEGVIFYLRCSCGSWLIKSAAPFDTITTTIPT
ncbi:hypothetical protein [Spongiactinospora rosea]|uniref:hypothetical protein n=1 Tax=Spongiactinospora rosea TaxID=2248750 RepID=UPI001314CA79|nr:hypothetical protein [Spongiactinospora rosea]